MRPRRILIIVKLYYHLCVTLKTVGCSLKAGTIWFRWQIWLFLYQWLTDAYISPLCHYLSISIQCLHIHLVVKEVMLHTEHLYIFRGLLHPIRNVDFILQSIGVSHANTYINTPHLLYGHSFWPLHCLNTVHLVSCISMQSAVKM